MRRRLNRGRPSKARRSPIVAWTRGVLSLLLLVAAWRCPAWGNSEAPSRSRGPRILKVLPQYVDLEGRTTLSPSLFDRDAYQFQLRYHPELRSGMRFAVLWKSWSRTAAHLLVKVEMRGSKGGVEKPVVLAVTTAGGRRFSHWVNVPVLSEAYGTLGDLIAWRVTLWEGERLLSEQKSFLW